MVSVDQRFVLSYNGEIYNFKELREELKEKSYSFRSHTDSEVVMNALAEWGSDALLKFNGMFALAFWDRKEKRLLIARDRYGIKPLYYHYNQTSFTFASEQKAILEDFSIHRRINKSPEGILYFSNIFTDQTLKGFILYLRGILHGSTPPTSNPRFPKKLIGIFAFRNQINLQMKGSIGRNWIVCLGRQYRDNWLAMLSLEHI